VIRENGRRLPQADAPDSTAVLQQLERILSTPLFQHSKRYPALLRYTVEKTLQGASEELKERTLGIEVFRRSPGYDTSADPVVRNTASEVRKRLNEYYAAGHDGELRIVLPPGGYVPEFWPAGRDVPILEEPEPAPAVPTVRRFRMVALAAIPVALLVFLGAYQLFSRASAVDLFWAPILRSSQPVLVVTDTWAARRPQADSGADSQAPRDVIDPKAFLYVTQQSAKLASFLLAHGKGIDYELARSIGIADLRERPFILKGAFNNQWTLRAVAPFRFYLQFDRNPDVRRILDRSNPQQRDWQAPVTPALAADYALIARAPEPQTGQMMLVIAGLGEQGTAAALEFVTNPKYLERLPERAPSGWHKRNIELVIKTDLVNGDWGEPRVVATHWW
jgi:hypothetical protein